MNVRLAENWMEHPKNKNAQLGKKKFVERREGNNHKFIKYVALANKSRLGFKEIWNFIHLLLSVFQFNLREWFSHLSWYCFWK